MIKTGKLLLHLFCLLGQKAELRLEKIELQLQRLDGVPHVGEVLKKVHPEFIMPPERLLGDMVDRLKELSAS